MAKATFERAGHNISAAFPAIHLFSASCWIAWVLLSYSGELFAEGADVHALDALCYFVSTLCISGAFVAFGLSKSRGYRIVKSMPALFGAAAATAIGTAMTTIASHGSGLFWSIAVCGSMLTGFGTGCIAMRCAYQFSELTPRATFMASAVALAEAMLIYSAVLMMPKLGALAVAMALPFGAVVFSFFDYGLDVGARSEGSRVVSAGFVRFVVAVFVLSVAFSLTRGFYPNGLRIDDFNLSRELVSGACIAFAAILVAIAALVPRGFAFGKLAYWVIVSTVFVFAVIPAAGLDSFLTGVAFSVGTAVLGVVSWGLFAAVSFCSGTSPSRVFGFGFPAFMLGSTVGWPLGFLLDASPASVPLEVVGVALLVLVFAVVFLLFRQEDVIAISQPVSGDEGAMESQGEEGAASMRERQEEPVGEERSEAASVGRKPRWRIRMLGLAQDYALSERETEVLLLMAKGRNARSISDELSVSYNTARTHIRNIYTKLDVHSQYEFQKLVEGEADSHSVSADKGVSKAE